MASTERPASEHRCAGGQQDEGERASEEEHVGAPRRCRAGDVIGGTRELDGGGAADTGGESQPDEHGKGVVDQPRLRLSPERGLGCGVVRRRDAGRCCRPRSRRGSRPTKRTGSRCRSRLGRARRRRSNRASSRILSGEASCWRSSGRKTSVRELSAMTWACSTARSSAVDRARMLIQNEPATPMTSSPTSAIWILRARPYPVNMRLPAPCRVSRAPYRHASRAGSVPRGGFLLVIR